MFEEDAKIAAERQAEIDAAKEEAGPNVADAAIAAKMEEFDHE